MSHLGEEERGSAAALHFALSLPHTPSSVLLDPLFLYQKYSYLDFPIYEKSVVVGTRKVKETNISLILMALTLCLYLRHHYTEKKILEILECERDVNFQRLFRHH